MSFARVRNRLARAAAVAVMAALPFLGRAAEPGPRARLAEAILEESPERQAALLKEVGASADPSLIQILDAWRNGAVYLHEEGDARVPFMLDADADEDGNARGLRVDDGSPILDEEGAPRMFASWEVVPVEADNALRRSIKGFLDLLALEHPEPRARRDAAVKLGQEQNPEYLELFRQRLATETNKEARRALMEAAALTRAASEDPETRAAAILELRSLRSITSLSFLKSMAEKAEADPDLYDAETERALRRAIVAIENYMWWGNLFGTGFRGLSLAAVLLVAALGLAITFGLMGVINMAHGEIIMVGAYTTYVTQNLFQSWFGASGAGFDLYFVAALGTSFVTAGFTGLLLERGIIRFLYRRPLESLLATWGVSLVLQQVFRHTFGAANVQVSSPSWLSGSFVARDILFAYNRLFVIGFAVMIVAGTYLLLTRTSLGLQIRAVMQNRAMASTLGVRTDRVNMMTFALGSGLAGMAGACLSQIGNVGPSLGQSYIIDCFMVVVLGGIGSLVGTVSAALGVGVADQVLQPWLGAVMGKITVLMAIILFLQWRPSGLFATRGRGLEG